MGFLIHTPYPLTMRTTLTLALLSLIPLFGQTQNQNPPPHRCLFDHLLHQYPNYRQNLDQVQAQALGNQIQQDHRRNLLTIPLAIHVVWKDSSERIDECKILEQVSILNQDFQRQNPDTSQLRAIFQGVAASPNIQFRLDTLIYLKTDSLFYSTGFFPDPSFGDKVKRASSGGSQGLPHQAYANVWICNLGNGGILGFAYPPANQANWPAGSSAPAPELEGVVLDYRIIGQQGLYRLTQLGQTINIVTQGRTATHEFGHYLGLRHIWGDGFGAQLGVPNCNDDDGIADTPLCGLPSNFECDTSQNTCGAGNPNDLPDMIENYMDYSTESCMNTFTQGQSQVMRGVLLANGPRESLNQTPAPNRPAAAPNNDLSQALSLSENLDGFCTQILSNQSLSAASPSWVRGQNCSNDQGRDVWYRFQARDTIMIIELSNLQAQQGSGGLGLAFYRGNCGNLTSLGCFSQNTVQLGGLTWGEDILVRVFAQDSSSIYDFDICVRSNRNVVGQRTTLSAASSFKLYPNPSQGFCYLTLPDDLGASAQLTLYDAQGRLLAQWQNLSSLDGVWRLDYAAQGLARGLYWLRLQSQDKVWTQTMQVEP